MMVFQHAFRTELRVRSKVVARYRVLSGVRWWCVLIVTGAVAYIALCGYVYNLSRERHRLMVQRNELRREYLLLQSQCEALRNPLRIQKQAKAYGMVLLTEPQAVTTAPVALARRN
jgi:cell division protein FtsL